MMNELKGAILTESLAAMKRKRKRNGDLVAKEIIAECGRIAGSMPTDLALAFLIDLLADTVFDVLRELAEEEEAPYEIIQ